MAFDGPNPPQYGSGVAEQDDVRRIALSLPESNARSTILAATYAAVLFSIVVQGSTLARVARWTLRTLW